MTVRWYWLRYVTGFLVTYHLARDYEVMWDRVLGVHIGRWFIGAVRSNSPLDTRKED